MKPTPVRALGLVAVTAATFGLVGCSSSDDAAKDVRKTGDEVANDLGAGASTVVDDAKDAVDDTGKGLEQQWDALLDAGKRFDSGAHALPADLQAGWARIKSDIMALPSRATSGVHEVRPDLDAGLRQAWADVKREVDSFDTDLHDGTRQIGDDAQQSWSDVKSAADRLDHDLTNA